MVLSFLSILSSYLHILIGNYLHKGAIFKVKRGICKMQKNAKFKIRRRGNHKLFCFHSLVSLGWNEPTDFLGVLYVGCDIKLDIHIVYVSIKANTAFFHMASKLGKLTQNPNYSYVFRSNFY